MKILFAIQGTGNGHISRAREVLPHLLNYGDVDVLISGTQAEISLPVIIKYKHHGLGYVFGKDGGIDMIESVKQLKPFRFLKDIYQFPVQQYDVVINDFEPLTAWACAIKQKPCIALSHQSAYLSNKTPRPEKKNFFAEKVFKYYAPTSTQYGFHFKSYDDFIYTPIIRNEVRQLGVSNQDHITVYLPAHGDQILVDAFKKHKDVKWQLFSKHTHQTTQHENVTLTPITNGAFIKSLASCSGFITAGGFESPAEAIHLGKKVLSIPMHNQYEQLCNAESMKDLGVTVISSIDQTFDTKLRTWIESDVKYHITFPDMTAQIIARLFSSILH
jgi:uncharacterized protein (TIGR00661 family)